MFVVLSKRRYSLGVTALKEAARAAYVQEEYETAISLLTEAIEKDPLESDLHSLRSSAYLALAAAKDFSKKKKARYKLPKIRGHQGG